MLEVIGKYEVAKVFTDTLEPEAYSQILSLCNQEFMAGSNVRVMPDVHAGRGCIIGLTFKVGDVVVPNLVGSDIGCGMETVRIAERRENIDLEAFDHQVKKSVLNGRYIRKIPHEMTENFDVKALCCENKLGPGYKKRGIASIGTLGGGNHFIELNEDEEGALYLVIHSGSRNIGLQVADLYQKEAELVFENKKKFNRGSVKIPKEFAYLDGALRDDYLHDMRLVQEYANLNRQTIVHELLGQMKWTALDRFSTVHNTIDTDSMILRKGAVSAQKGERLLIPMNMRDGSLICIGKGNSDWNCSAPHGAGRLMRRRDARENLSMDEFIAAMHDIFSTSVSKAIIDEAPMAYKPMKKIVEHIGPTAEIVKRLKPIYNFKATE